MTVDHINPPMTNAPTDGRLAKLVAAQDRALALLDVVRERNLIQPGQTERDIEQEILRIAENEFGVKQNWHKRIVRAGKNTLAVFAENPPVLTVQHDDIVFLDLGPVFGTWEADVGETFVVGSDREKQALVDALGIQFDTISARLMDDPDITGADLYRFACENAVRAGFKFGGQIAGHIVAEFPHHRLPGDRQAHHISPANPLPLSLPDANGNARYWIIEVHLISQCGNFGGFYERLASTIRA